MITLIQRAARYPERIAVLDPGGRYTYARLLEESARQAMLLLDGRSGLQEARIAFMVRPGYAYVRTQWAIWRAGGVAVPICVAYPAPAIRYVLEDAGVTAVVTEGEFRELLDPLCRELGLAHLAVETPLPVAGELPDVSPSGRAMILYTSGTTGRPKGVVTLHAALEAQVSTLVEAWGWTKEDHILNILPLHHVHGIVNVLSCALWSGACCEFLPAFDAGKVVERFLRGEVNLFMAVPTIYYKLIDHWKQLPGAERKELSDRLRKFRLMVSGSAALPVSTLEQWREISGQTLLERYGMTEMGMAISNPYRGERRPGHIGQALPGVRIRLVDEDGKAVTEGIAGEIQVKGPNVFREYWNKPEATAAAFTPDGWFRTGDIAEWNAGSYRILGRDSVDIIKSGGYKISALEIEEVLRQYPSVRDCAVVGIPDPEWGERVVAGLVAEAKDVDTTELTTWLRERLPGYKTPRRYLFLEELPRNALGKVTKNELKKQFT